ncbi:MAG: S66 peptidase family protein [Bacteroidota bacterium]
MKKPSLLQVGDKIAIVATARKVAKTDINPAIELLHSWGFEVEIGSSIGLENHQFAGTDQQRADDFQQQLDNPEIKAIWCAKGGYGSVRLLDLIDFRQFINHPKWIIGYSDVTAIHTHIHNLGVGSLHAQMAVQVNEKSNETKESLWNCLLGNHQKYQFNSTKLNRFGKAKGQLIGGNLSVLYSLCGSKSAPTTNGKILFIEDLDEYLYHIDRMMQNLKRNGMLSDLNALLVGGMTDMNDNSIPFGKTAEEIITAAVSEYDYPVAFQVPVGHLYDNRALLFGEEMSVEVNQSETILQF